MKILALETSCDDTAVAVVEDGYKVIASVRLSQAEHADWGGVVPEIAARLHAENWRPALEKCLDQAKLHIKDIDALAVTQGPGLQTSLLTGTTTASFLSQLYQKPLIPVHHIYGHLCSVFLERDLSAVKFPALVLTASGGHTELYLWKDPTTWEKLGGTLDDAAGEAFDKVAKMLGLSYPGGPIVSQKAIEGDRTKYVLPVPKLGKDSLDFSFSGIKAAVYRLVEKHKTEASADPDFIEDMCASFETTAATVFVKKVETALRLHPTINSVCFVGGVSANTFIKKELSASLKATGRELLTPVKIEYSTDNAAMIASAAYALYKQDPSLAQVAHVNAEPRLSL